MELPVVNHPDYVAKINDDNKFPIKKFGALANHLIETGVVKRVCILTPKNVSKQWLDELWIHFNLNFSLFLNS